MILELSKFLEDFREPDGLIKDIYDRDEYLKIPKKSGAYIFLSSSQKFIYPNGKSRVIYIGKGDNLFNRLYGHKNAFSKQKKIKK